MKRTTILLGALFLAIALVGCGSGSSESTANDPAPKSGQFEGGGQSGADTPGGASKTSTDTAQSES